ncbi:MAG: hypothetical protein M1609_11625 [Firmicutes bacterium]|nr:hypothetical protein [Bacillota bacterium]
MSSSQQKSVFPGAYFELAANVNNELWSIGLSQLKLLNVTQQQVGALLVNGIQKHHQAHKCT